MSKYDNVEGSKPNKFARKGHQYSNLDHPNQKPLPVPNYSSPFATHETQYIPQLTSKVGQVNAHNIPSNVSPHQTQVQNQVPQDYNIPSANQPNPSANAYQGGYNEPQRHPSPGQSNIRNSVPFSNITSQRNTESAAYGGAYGKPKVPEQQAAGVKNVKDSIDILKAHVDDRGHDVYNPQYQQGLSQSQKNIASNLAVIHSQRQNQQLPEHNIHNLPHVGVQSPINPNVGVQSPTKPNPHSISGRPSQKTSPQKYIDVEAPDYQKNLYNFFGHPQQGTRNIPNQSPVKKDLTQFAGVIQPKPIYPSSFDQNQQAQTTVNKSPPLRPGQFFESTTPYNRANPNIQSPTFHQSPTYKVPSYGQSPDQRKARDMDSIDEFKQKMGQMRNASSPNIREDIGLKQNLFKFYGQNPPSASKGEYLSQVHVPQPEYNRVTTAAEALHQNRAQELHNRALGESGFNIAMKQFFGANLTPEDNFKKNYNAFYRGYTPAEGGQRSFGGVNNNLAQKVANNQSQNQNRSVAYPPELRNPVQYQPQVGQYGSPGHQSGRNPSPGNRGGRQPSPKKVIDAFTKPAGMPPRDEHKSSKKMYNY